MLMDIISNQLKELKLEGMQEAFRQLSESGLYVSKDFEVMLQQLISAESEYRRDRKSFALAKKAAFRYHASIQSVLIGTSRNLDKSTLSRLAEGRYLKQGQNILITGPTGAGKSYLACALGQQACRQGYKTAYYNCNKLWNKLNTARKHEKYYKEIKHISRMELLILDDFGLARLEAMERLSLLEILEDRWGKSATIIVSQRPLNTWHDILGEPTIADAVCDRVFSNCEKIELKGDSLRKTAEIIDSNLPLQ
jgi:DNA replication protein DnaC